MNPNVKFTLNKCYLCLQDDLLTICYDCNMRLRANEESYCFRCTVVYDYADKQLCDECKNLPAMP